MKAYPSSIAYQRFCAFLVFWMCLVGLVFPTKAEAIQLSGAGDSVRIGKKAKVFEDPTGTLTLEEVQREARAGRFSGPIGNLEFGFSESAHWVHFRIQNDHSKETTYYFNSAYALIDSIDIYEIHPDGVVKTSLGDALPYKSRTIDTVSFTHRISVPARETREIYMRVQSTSSLSLPAILYGADAFIGYIHDQMLLLGAFYGVALGLFAYNFFLLLMTRERIYVSYLLFVAFSVVFSAALDGTTYRLYPEAVYWQQVSTYFYIAGCAYFAMMFGRLCLDTEKNLPRTHKVMGFSQTLFLVFGVVCLIFPSRVLSLVILLSLNLVLATLSFCSVVLVLKGEKSAQLFAAGWSVMIVSVAVGILTATGVLPLHEILPITHKIGVACEMILLSMGLANRINSLKSAEQRAKNEASEANAAVQAKSDFLAKMSHEIRTPMNGVLGMTELLSQTKLTQHQESCVNTIYGSGRALLRIINDILDLSKLEAGKMEIEAASFDLEALVDECAAMFAVRAADKKVPLIVRCDSRCGPVVTGDSSRIRQVLVNLLSNAYKFTERGQVELEVRRVSESQDVLFSVKDSGVGISKKGQARLFESFAQEDSSITRKYGGTGLGLAICKQIAEAMGGSIGVQSEKGHGALFWFRIPLTQCCDESAAQVAEQCRMTTEGQTWFFLGEESVQGKALIELMSGSCERVVVMTQVEELASKIQEFGTPDLCVVHEEDSSVACKGAIRALLDSHQMPVLLSLSARCLELRELALDQARVTLLEQPLTRRRFLNAVRSSLGQGGERELSSETAEKGEQAGGVELGSLKVLAAEDNPVNQMVLKGMLKHLGLSADFANNGAIAVDLVRAAETPYDLVLMDCEMPEMDGYTATREIRKIDGERGQRTVIFALSAHVLDEHRQRGAQAGMDGFLAKPIDLAVLREVMEGVLAGVERAA